MRIGVMLRHFEQKDGGVRVYTRRVLPLLFALGAAHDFVPIYQDPKLLGTFRRFANVEEVVSRLPGTLLWDQIAVPRIARRHRLDMIFNPKFTVPFFTRARTVFVLHGSEWFAIPQHFLWYDRAYFKRFVPAYCRSADAFVAVSHAVAFRLRAEPAPVTLTAVRVTVRRRGDRVVAVAQRMVRSAGIQLQVLCARGAP